MAIDENFLDEIEAELAANPLTEFTSIEEFQRHQEMLFHHALGGSLPAFRTRVTLRFSGQGVAEHDLRAEAGTSVVGSFISAVKTAGSGLKSSSKLPLDAFELFWSPNVAPGSTILELFGAPIEVGDQPTLNEFEIPDSPVDTAISLVLESIERVDPSNPVDEFSSNFIAAELGSDLFRLAKSIVDNDVDLDVAWQRPRGLTRSTNLTRDRATHLQNLLDKPTSTTVTLSAFGELQYVSTKGVLGIKPEKGAVITITVPDDHDHESFRHLWARRVRVQYKHRVDGHMNRKGSAIKNTLIAITLADQVQIDEI